MSLGYQTKNISAKAAFKDVDEQKGIVTGYFAHFGSLDSDGDVIEKGAFSKTIQERGPDSTQPRVKYLRNHFTYEPIGVITSLKEDNTGLAYEAKIGDWFVATDTAKMIAGGAITEHSFGFDTTRKDVKNGTRYLKELVLWEGSALTAWGANHLTGAATLKSMGPIAYVEMMEKRQKALETFIRNTTATDETIELLLIESKQLTQLILDISKQATTPDDESTLPDEIGDVMDNFISSLKN